MLVTKNYPYLVSINVQFVIKNGNMQMDGERFRRKLVEK